MQIWYNRKIRNNFQASESQFYVHFQYFVSKVEKFLSFQGISLKDSIFVGKKIQKPLKFFLYMDRFYVACVLSIHL